MARASIALAYIQAPPPRERAWPREQAGRHFRAGEAIGRLLISAGERRSAVERVLRPRERQPASIPRPGNNQKYPRIHNVGNCPGLVHPLQNRTQEMSNRNSSTSQLCGKAPKFSEPQFPHLYIGGSFTLIILVKTDNIQSSLRYMETCCVPSFITGKNGFHQEGNLALSVDIFNTCTFPAIPLLNTNSKEICTLYTQKGMC